MKKRKRRKTNSCGEDSTNFMKTDKLSAQTQKNFASILLKVRIGARARSHDIDQPKKFLNDIKLMMYFAIHHQQALVIHGNNTIVVDYSWVRLQQSVSFVITIYFFFLSFFQFLFSVFHTTTAMWERKNYNINI